MKRLLLSAILLGASVASTPAQTQDKPADLTTVSGKTYKQARVFRVEPDGITYMYAGGMSKIEFTDLPEEVRKKYGYDPKAAAQFAQADAFEQAQVQQASIQASRQAQAAREKMDTAYVADLDKAKAEHVRADALLRWKQKLASQGLHVKATVVRQMDDGSVVTIRKKTSLYTWADDEEENAIYLVGAPKNVADGETLETDIYPCGTFQPGGSGGKTYRSYCTSLDAAAARQVHD